MTDLSANPEELTIGESSGIFTLENLASNANTYVVDVIVTTTDGTNPVTETITSVVIEKICGLSSTTLTYSGRSSLS